MSCIFMEREISVENKHKFTYFFLGWIFLIKKQKNVFNFHVKIRALKINWTVEWRMLITATVNMLMSSFIDTWYIYRSIISYSQFQNPKSSENENSCITYLGTKTDVKLLLVFMLLYLTEYMLYLSMQRQ